MSRNRTVIIIMAMIFLLSAVMTLYFLKTSQNQTVEIVQDGEIIYTFDLSVTENQTITIKSKNGKSSNTITISDGKICISDSECSDKICVKSGFLKSERLPIVCLPNRLIIRFCNEEN